MFVRSDWTRRDIGRAILDSCERAARDEGFTSLALIATLPGEPLSRSLGFREVERPARAQRRRRSRCRARVDAARGHEVVGPKGKHDRDRVAVRHGHEGGSMTLGGRRVQVRRPRMRTADDEHELRVAAYGYFADRDPLTRAVMDRMLAGVSTRTFARVGEPVGEEVERSSSSTGKTAVSDMFIERTRTAPGELMARAGWTTCAWR